MEFTIGNLKIKPISFSEVDALQDLFNKSSDYFELVEKRMPREGDAEAALKALPPKKETSDKIVLGIYDNKTFVGVIDLVKNYPKENMWFLGLLLLAPELRNNAVGSQLYMHLKSILKDKGVLAVMISVAEENEKAIRFWKKLGFIEKNTKIQDKGGREVGFVYLENVL